MPMLRDTWMTAAAAMSDVDVTFRIRRMTDGAVRWVHIEATPLLDASGELDGWVGSTVDVTEETASIADLRRFSEILAATPDLVAMVDAGGHFTYANAAARERFGIDSDEKMLALRAIDVYAPTSRSLFLGDALPTANRLGVWSGEVDLLLPDGEEIPVSQVLVAHRRPDGSIDYYSSITRDLTEKRQIEQELARAGMYDALTGLPQRPLFVDALGHAMEAAIESGVQVAVLLLGLDHFKLVNDSFGHDSGDLMLRLVTQRLEGFVRHGDLLARFSGDVFCLLVNAVPSEVEALRIADEIATAMAEPYQLDGDEVFVTMSVGIAMSGGVESVATPETMLRDADAALHRAKERGRARSELFVEDYRATAVHRLRTANDLHRALTEQEFRVVYQPEVDLRTGSRHRRRGPRALAPPGARSRAARRVHPARRADRAHRRHRRVGARHRAARRPRTGGRRGPTARALTVWVNLSARQLGDPAWSTLVADTLSRHGVRRGAAGAGDHRERAARGRRGRGHRAVGAARARRAPRRRRLRHRLLVAVLPQALPGRRGQDRPVLRRRPRRRRRRLRDRRRGRPAWPARCGSTTIAEGVENLDQLHALKRLGCDLAQGYFFTTPQPPSAHQPAAGERPRAAAVPLRRRHRRRAQSAWCRRLIRWGGQPGASANLVEGG